jgi:hypothetical protein
MPNTFRHAGRTPGWIRARLAPDACVVALAIQGLAPSTRIPEASGRASGNYRSVGSSFAWPTVARAAEIRRLQS